MTSMVEKVAEAIEGVKLFSRYNDWTSDRVDGLPIEVGYVDQNDETIIIARFAGREEDCAKRREEMERIGRARAAIEAMKAPSNNMLGAMWDAMYEEKFDGTTAPMMGAGFEAAIDAALAESKEG